MKLLGFSFLVFLRSTCAQFEVPDALVEVFRPRGLRVSIPDQDGIKLFAFHAKVNEEMNGREGGTFSRDILKPKNGRWTFYDPYAALKVGDVLYYWTYVDYFDGKNKLGYTNDDNTFTVKELIDKNTGSGTPSVTQNPLQEQPTENSCKPSITNKQKFCSGQAIFTEDFNEYRPNVWSPEIRFAGRPDYEFVMYSNRVENLQVKNGFLEIHPLPTDEIFGKGFVKNSHELNLGRECTGIPGSTECVQQPDAYLILPPVTSSQITTKNTWSFKYGKVEIRAKLPRGNWIYPELFLSPLGEEYGPGYTSGQIRIAFLAGNKDSNHNLQGGCVLGDSRAARNYGMRSVRKNQGSWSDDFHKFTVIWKPDQITVSVDDTVYGNIYAPEGGFISETSNLDLENVERWRGGSEFAPFDKRMYLTIGVGVGGLCFEDRSDGSKPWINNEAKGQKKFYKAVSQWRPTWTNDSALIIDYVKVSAL